MEGSASLTYAASAPEKKAWLTGTAVTTDGIQTTLITGI